MNLFTYHLVDYNLNLIAISSNIAIIIAAAIIHSKAPLRGRCF